MKTLVILLASVLAAGSLTGCVAEPETTDSVLRPTRKPPLESPTSEAGTHESGIDDGRIMWVEVFGLGDSAITKVHHFDSDTGIDSVDVLDVNDVVVRVETRYQPVEIPATDRR